MIEILRNERAEGRPNEGRKMKGGGGKHGFNKK